MGMQQCQTAIRDKLTAEWPHASVTLKWQNEPNLIATGETFVYVEVIGEEETHAAYGGGVGANEWIQHGCIQGHILVPRNKGIDAARGYADSFAAIFRGKRFNNISCFSASQVGGDVSADNGNYWMLTVVVDFQYRFKG